MVGHDEDHADDGEGAQGAGNDEKSNTVGHDSILLKLSMRKESVSKIDIAAAAAMSAADAVSQRKSRGVNS